MFLPESSRPWTVQRRIEMGLYALLAGKRGVEFGAGQYEDPAWRWWELPEVKPYDIDVKPYDRRDFDAHVPPFPDNAVDFVYTSHLVEHLTDPNCVLTNWLRIVEPGGLVYFSVPHRDLYERRTTLPSRWNPDHRRFYLPDFSEPPCTVGLREWLEPLRARMRFELLRVDVGDYDYEPTPPHVHPKGEYQIDVVLRKDN